MIPKMGAPWDIHANSMETRISNAWSAGEFPRMSARTHYGFAGPATVIGRLVLPVLFAGLASGAHSAEPTGRAVEFYNTDLHHYFITAFPEEAAGIDKGTAGPGWTRTGGSFGVFLDAADEPALVPVCRFYGTPGKGPNSHFYTADAAECEAVKKDPGWTFEGIAYYIRPLSPSAACDASSTPVYRSYNNGYIRNDSNHRFTIDLTVQQNMPRQGYSLEGPVMCAALSQADRQADASRLAQQATFGPTDALIGHIVQVGDAAFLDEQFNATATQYPLYPYVINNDPTCVNSTALPTTPTSFCARDNYTLYPLQRQFFVNALKNPDQLRQRVAFALSQIFVTSGIDNRINYAMRHYQQIFLDKAFGNFEDILATVTLSPQMGDYLNMANNDKGDPAKGTLPNENYAREVLQLFCIGLWKLNQDGTQKTDAQGNPIPTYGQDEIKAFARVFTGWTYPVTPGQAARSHNPPYYVGVMTGVAGNHDSGQKTLLDGANDAAAKTMEADLAFALHDIFMHSNAGPFIGRQLIQKLVTGNPSPQYVGRVAAVFNDNGQGVRGDLKAVVRAILLDPEARGAAKIDPGYGKLREPVLYITNLARATNTASDGDYFINQSANQGQNVFYPPTVFNYYAPDYTLAEANTIAPEFQILDSTTSLSRINYANSFFFGTINPNQFLYGATGTSPDLSALQPLAATIWPLIDKLNALLMNSSMSDAMKGNLFNALNAISASDTLTRTKTALYLLAASPQFQVER
jgi:uncharacterized protein (DUF1800 family)